MCTVTVINICMEYYMYGEMKCLLSVVEMYEPYMNYIHVEHLERN